MVQLSLKEVLAGAGLYLAYRWFISKDGHPFEPELQADCSGQVGVQRRAKDLRHSASADVINGLKNTLMERGITPCVSGSSGDMAMDQAMLERQLYDSAHLSPIAPQSLVARETPNLNIKLAGNRILSMEMFSRFRGWMREPDVQED